MTSSGKPPVRRFNRFFNPCLKEEAYSKVCEKPLGLPAPHGKRAGRLALARLAFATRAKARVVGDLREGMSYLNRLARHMIESKTRSIG